MVQQHDSVRWKRIARVLESEAAQLTSPLSQSRKYRELGALWAKELGDSAKSAEFYSLAVELDPTCAEEVTEALSKLVQDAPSPKALNTLIEILESTGRVEELVRWTLRGVHPSMKASEAFERCVSAAELALSRLDDRALAAECIEAVFKQSKGENLQRILILSGQHLGKWPDEQRVAVVQAETQGMLGQHDEAMQTVVAASAHSTDNQAKASLRMAAARICVQHLNQPFDAINHLRDALAFEPEFVAEGLTIISRIQSKWTVSAELAEYLVETFDELGYFQRSQSVWNQCIEHSPLEERASLMLKRALHAERTLAEPNGTFAQFQAGAEYTQYRDETFVAGMRRAALDGALGGFQSLSTKLEESGQWRLLVELIDAQACLLAEDIERARLVFNAGVILEEKLEETQEAMERYLQAYRLDTTVPEYVIAGERIYRERENWVMVDELLQRRLDMTPTPDVELELLLEQGQIRAGQLGEPMAAYDALRRALRTPVPNGGQRVYAALSDVVCDVWAWPSIEEGLWARIDNTSTPKRKARLLQEVSFLYLEFLKDTERGLQALRDAADACPDDREIFERVTDQFEVHADDLVLARWLYSVRERPLPETLRFESVARALDIFESLGADWLVLRDVFGELMTVRPTHDVLLPKALSAAEKVNDLETFVELLERAIVSAEKDEQVNEDVVLEWRRKLAKAHNARGAFAEAIQHHRAILQQWPLDADAFQALSEIFREQADWMSLSSLYQQVVRARESEDALVDIEGRLAWAEILADELQDIPNAIECLKPVAVAPLTDTKALTVLKSLYQRNGDVTGEFEILEIELDVQAPGATRDILDQMDQLLNSVGDTRGELKERLLTHKLAAMPESFTIRLQLAARHRDRGEHEELNASLAAAWQAEPSKERLSVLQERGRLLRYEMRRLSEAVDVWETFLRYEPNDLEALAELQYLYDQEQRHDDVRRVMAIQLAHVIDETRRISILRERAILSELRFGDAQDAYDALLELLEYQPYDVETLEELLRLADELGHHAAMVDFGVRWLDIDPDVSDAHRLRQLAQAADAVESPDAIIFWRRLHVLLPDEHDVLEALAEHALAIEAIDEAMELFGRLSHSDAAIEVRRRALHVRADLLVELGQLDEAERSYRRLALVNPHSPLPWLALKDLLIRRFDYVAAGEALAEAIERTTAPEQKAELGRALAMMLADEVGDLDGSIRHWERVLALESHDIGALSALWPLYGKQGRVDDMLRVLDAHGQVASHVGEAGQYLIDAAEWLEKECDDLRAALACWVRAHRVLGYDHNRDRLERIEQLSTRTKQFDTFVEVLVLTAEREQASEEKGAYLYRASQVCAEKKRDIRQALTLACQALQADPASPLIRERLLEHAHRLSTDAGWIQLAETFERLAETAGDPGEFYRLAGDAMNRAEDRELDAFELYAEAFSESHGIAGAEPLFTLAEQYQWWPELEELIEATLKGLEPKIASERLVAFGGLYEQVGADHHAAFGLYRRAYRLEQSTDVLEDDIWRLADFLDGWTDVVTMFDTLVDNSTDPERRSEFLFKRAEVEITRLSNRARGIETLKRAISSAPYRNDLHECLEQWLEQEDEYLAIARFYEEEGAWSQAIDIRVMLYRLASQAYKRCGDAPSAARLLTMISEVSPDDQALFAERTELLEHAEEWAQLADLLQRQSERVSMDERVEILRRLAEICEHKLDDVERAIQTWEQLLEVAPSDRDVFRVLRRALMKQNAWERLEHVISIRLPIAEANELPDLLEQRAVILDRHLEQPARAIPILFELIQCAPERFDMMQRLESLITRREDAIRLIGIIDTVLESSADLDHDGRLSLLVGRLAQTKADRPQRALDAYRMVIQARPSDLTLAREVGALMIRQRKHEDLLELYGEYGPSYFDKTLEERGAYTQQAEVDWLEAMSLLQEERLLDIDGAVQSLEALIALDPGHYSGLERLRRLLFRLRDVPRMLAVIEGVAQHVERTQAVIFLVEGARAIQATGTLDNAIPLWRQVLEFAPGHEEAQGICMRHARRAQDVEAIAEVFQAKIRSARSPEDQAARLTEFAAFEESQRHNIDEAIKCLRRAVRVDPSYGLGLAHLARLALQTNDDSLIRELSPILLHQFDIGFSDQELSEVSPYLAEVQVYLANCMGAEDDVEPIVHLRDGYQRTPNQRAVAQAYADALFDAGELVAAGEIYQDIALPTFEPGSEGDVDRARENLRRAQAFEAIGLDVRAIHHFEAAARHAETRMIALSALASIQEAAGRWEAVVRLKEKLTESLEVGHRGATFVQLGDILEKQLGRTQRAIAMYVKALDDGFSQPVGLLKILDFFEHAGRETEALATLERLLQRKFGEAALARLFLRKAALHQHQGEISVALSLTFEAMCMQPQELAIFEKWTDLFAHMDVEQRSDAINRSIEFIESASTDVGVDVKCRWASWLLGVDRQTHAKRLYEDVLNHGTRTFEVLDGLARIESSDGLSGDGPSMQMTYRLESLRINPGHIGALSHLGQIFADLGYPRTRDPAAGLLTLFGHTTRSPVASADGEAVFGHLLTSDGNIIEQFWRDVEEHPLSLLFDGLLMIVGDAYNEIYQRDMVPDGLELSEHLVTVPSPLTAMSDAMGWPAVTLYELPISQDEPHLMSISDANLAVSPAFRKTLSDGDQLYRLVRAYYLSRGWRAFVSSIPDEHTRGLLGGLCALTDSEWGPEFALELSGDEELIAHWAEFLFERCPAEVLAEFAPFVQTVADMGADELVRWKQMMNHTADIVAFMITGDFSAALREGKSRVTDAQDVVVSGPSGFTQLLAEVPSLRVLHDFAFSLEYCGFFLDEERTMAGDF